MSDNKQVVRIAVNVMRTRLTVIGLNIAIVSFQITQLYSMSGGVNLPGVDHQVHVRADIALYLALSLSLIALVAFLASSSHDEVGYCDHWSFIAGDLLMYLGLAYTITGFFAPLFVSFNLFGDDLPSQVTQVIIFQKTILFCGATAWFLAMYVGPIITLLRSPFSRRANVSLGIFYVVVIVLLSWVNSEALMFENEMMNASEKTVKHIYFLLELVQPLIW
ncbi:hypothetical protein [Desulfogranum marinum]|uniref:hypothetical protein n=1 Tax=Desulfogranum marinum TaxID=453220 RepID=UPI0029C71982|nr:hypothetical protein [Desulfogranum marinum]